MALARSLIVALSLAVLGPGCSARIDPVGPRAPTTAAAIPVMGHVVTVRVHGERGRTAGELIAATSDGLWVRSGIRAVAEAVGPRRVVGVDDRERHIYFPRSALRLVRVHRYEARAATLATAIWGVSAVGLSFSHGFFALYTAPATAVVATVAALATHLQSVVILTRPKPEALAELRRFARFPAGAPEGWPDLVPTGVGATPFEQEERAPPERRAEAKPSPPRYEIMRAPRPPTGPRAYDGPTGVRSIDP